MRKGAEMLHIARFKDSIVAIRGVRLVVNRCFQWQKLCPINKVKVKTSHTLLVLASPKRQAPVTTAIQAI